MIQMITERLNEIMYYLTVNRHCVLNPTEASISFPIDLSHYAYFFFLFLTLTSLAQSDKP